MFARAVDDAPEAVAFRHRDVSLTYSEAGRAVAALARRQRECRESVNP
jgi:hypothetical protein